MKAEALTDTTINRPEAHIYIELKDNTMLKATGFVVREDEDGNPIIILKIGKTPYKRRKGNGRQQLCRVSH